MSDQILTIFIFGWTVPLSNGVKASVTIISAYSCIVCSIGMIPQTMESIDFFKWFDAQFLPGGQ